MSRRAWLLVLEFFALTVPLTWVWVTYAQAAYVEALPHLAAPLLAPLGITELVESPAHKRFVSYVPYLVLVCITPGLGLRRRVVGLLVGMPLIFLCHVGLVLVEFLAYTDHRPTEDPFSTVFPAAMFADAFPFILWAILCHRLLRDLLARALEARDAGA